MIRKSPRSHTVARSVVRHTDHRHKQHHADEPTFPRSSRTIRETAVGKIGQMSGRFNPQTKRRYEVGPRVTDIKAMN